MNRWDFNSKEQMKLPLLERAFQLLIFTAVFSLGSLLIIFSGVNFDLDKMSEMSNEQKTMVMNQMNNVISVFVILSFGVFILATFQIILLDAKKKVDN